MNKILLISLLSVFCFFNDSFAQSTKCNTCRKVVFVVDNSGSVSGSEYSDMKQSISAIVDEISVSSPGTEMAVVQYAGIHNTLDPGKYDISVPFTTSSTVAKSWNRAYGSFNGIYNDFLPASFETMRLDMIWDAGGTLELDAKNCKPVFIVFTDAVRDQYGSSIFNGGTYSGMPGFEEYNYLKKKYNVHFIVYHVTGGSLMLEKAGAAIASVGGNYKGGIEPNLGDPDGSMVLPRDYIVGTFIADPKSITTIIGSVTEVTSAIKYVDDCRGNFDFFGSSGTSDPLIKWHWTFGDGTNSNLQNPVHNYPPGSYELELTVEGLHGCRDTTKQVIEVMPTTVDAGPDKNFCSAQRINIGNPSISGAKYNWSPGNTLSDSTAANPVSFATQTTTYYLSLLWDNGCKTDKDSMLLTLKDSPQLTFPTTFQICEKDTVLIGPAPDSTLRYLWTPATGLSQTNTAQTKASPSVSSDYWLTATNSYGCQSQQKLSINVNVLPVAEAGPDVTDCFGIGKSIGNPPVMGVSYNWYPALGLSDANIANPIANATKTTRYYVNAIDVNGCRSQMDSMLLVIHDNPVLSFSTNAEICQQDSVIIGPAPDLTLSYLWTPANGLSQATVAQPKASPSVSSDYILTATNAFGCQATQKLSLKVNVLPTVDAGPDLVGCTAVGKGIGNLPVAGFSYNWFPASGLSDAGIANPVVTVTETTRYYVNAIDSNGCHSQTDSMLLIVYGNPVLSFSNHVEICGKDSVMIGPEPNVSLSYLWEPSAGLSEPGAAQTLASPTVSGNYTLTATNIFGCSSTSPVFIQVFDLPQADAGPDLTLCENEEVKVAYTGSLSFQWSPPLPSDGLLNPLLGQTSYTLTVRDSNGCYDSDTKLINVYPNPIADFTTEQELSILDPTIQLLNHSLAAESYLWDFGDGTESNDVNPEHTYAEGIIGNQTIILTAISAFGCKDTAQISVYLRDELVFYIPNSFTPNSDRINDRFKPVFNSGYDPSTYHLSIYNRWGELIFESFDLGTGWDGIYKGEAVQDGTYIWKVEFATRNGSENLTRTGHLNLLN